MSVEKSAVANLLTEINTHISTNLSAIKSKHNDPVAGKLIETLQRGTIIFVYRSFYYICKSYRLDTFPMVGTFMTNRKNTPKFPKMKLQRGETRFRINNHNSTASNWQDCKEVNVLSNCHGPEVVKIKRKMKNGDLEEFDCPMITKTYNEIMGGVDLSDQKMQVYDLGRKSKKWWKKVFIRLLMSAVVNSWIVFKEFHQNMHKLELKNFIVPLAEDLCLHGKKITQRSRKVAVGRPCSIARDPSEHHLAKCTTRRRCAECSKTKKETTFCNFCSSNLE